MEGNTYLYIVKYINRRNQYTGISCGVVHAPSAEGASTILMQKMGDNAYAFQILDVTEKNGEAYIGIPSGELIAFENT